MRELAPIVFLVLAPLLAIPTVVLIYLAHRSEDVRKSHKVQLALLILMLAMCALVMARGGYHLWELSQPKEQTGWPVPGLPRRE